MQHVLIDVVSERVTLPMGFDLQSHWFWSYFLQSSNDVVPTEYNENNLLSPIYLGFIVCCTI